MEEAAENVSHGKIRNNFNTTKNDTNVKVVLWTAINNVAK